MPNVTFSTLLFNSVDMATTNVANHSSALLDLGNAINVACELRAASDTHVGVVSFAGCNKPDETPIALEIPTVTVSNGAALASLVELANICFQYLQVIYTAASGAGNLFARFHVKKNR
jgi:hypothetical protein